MKKKPNKEQRLPEGAVVGDDGKLLVPVSCSGDFFAFKALVPFIPNKSQSAKPSIELDIPKIPYDAAHGGYIQCYDYFAKVYRTMKSEAFVWWHYDIVDGYKIVVPRHTRADSGGLQYPIDEKFCPDCQVATNLAQCPHCKSEDLNDLQILGTSHSHGAMSAFHSVGDDANELDTTGFHITFGNVDNPAIKDVAGSFVVSKGRHRFKTDPLDHFEFKKDDDYEKRVSLWVSLVRPPTRLKTRSVSWPKQPIGDVIRGQAQKTHEDDDLDSLFPFMERVPWSDRDTNRSQEEKGSEFRESLESCQSVIDILEVVSENSNDRDDQLLYATIVALTLTQSNASAQQGVSSAIEYLPLNCTIQESFWESLEAAMDNNLDEIMDADMSVHADLYLSNESLAKLEELEEFDWIM